MTLLQAVAARRAYFLTSATVLVLDQITKIVAHLLLRGRGLGDCADVPSPLHRADAGCLEVIPGFFNLWYSRNPGGLFGFFGGLPDPWRNLLLTLIPLVAVVLIALFLAKTDEPDRTTLIGLSLILGGAIGNLIDRLVRGGEVVDFLDVYASSPQLAEWFTARFGTAHWPTFNLADSAIVVGACLLVLDVLRPTRPSPSAETPPPEESTGP